MTASDMLARGGRVTAAATRWTGRRIRGEVVKRVGGPARARVITLFGAANVHFTPRARTAWHTHPHGQTIWVTEGVGLCQRRGGPIEVIRPGDRAFFEPGEDHWHGAAPTRFMTHIAIQQADQEGNVVTWGDQVTDDEYAQAPEVTT